MRARGVTLLELMIVIVVTSVGITAACAMMLAMTQVSTNHERVADAEEGARVAQTRLQRLVRQAGMGGRAGVWVVPSGGGAPTQINAVFGADGTSGPILAGTLSGRDDLWLVEPSANALREGCTEAGGATVVTAPGPGGGDLPVACTGSLAAGGMALVSNLESAALITQLRIVDPHTVAYAEAQAGFSDAPLTTGFQAGDWVYGVSLLHFYVATDPVSGRPALFEAEGQLQTDALGRPFSDVPGTARLVQPDVEDLQVTYGFDASGRYDPSQYVFTDGLAPAYRAGLRSVNVSVVSRTHSPLRDTAGRTISTSDNAPQAVENHVPAAVVDGYRRDVLRERVEIPNMATEAL